jgi:hypothetical protein
MNPREMLILALARFLGAEGKIWIANSRGEMREIPPRGIAMIHGNLIIQVDAKQEDPTT